MVWTYDDLVELNRPRNPKKDGILAHLLQIGAATVELLCLAAEELDGLGTPFVACFGQLPVALDIGSEPAIPTVARQQPPLVADAERACGKLGTVTSQRIMTEQTIADELGDEHVWVRRQWNDSQRVAKVL